MDRDSDQDNKLPAEDSIHHNYVVILNFKFIK